MVKTPKVSVLVPCYRPGGIDITLASMANQTYKDFELILVDRRYEIRHDAVVKAAQDYSVKTIHAPEHRRNGQWITAATAYNTAACLASGELILFLHDWWYAQPNWIEENVRLLDGNPKAISLSGYLVREPPKLKTNRDFKFEGRELQSWNDREEKAEVIRTDEVLNGDILNEVYTFEDGPFQESWIGSLKDIMSVKYRPSDLWFQDGRPELIRKGMAPNHTWSFMCNDGMHREFFMSVGGHDELFDKTKGMFDAEFAWRSIRSGAKFSYSVNTLCISIRPQLVVRSMPCGKMQERTDDRWSNKDNEEYFLMQKNSSRLRAKNPIDVRDIARRIAFWRKDDAKRIPLDVPDEIYWGQSPLWPEDLPDSFFVD